jgi:hypothetical protein
LSLVAAIEAHASDVERENGAHVPRRAWVASKAEAWARSVPTPTKIDVFTWVRWLDSGAPAAADKFGRPVAPEKPYRTMSEPSVAAEGISQEEYDAAPAVWAPQIAKGKFYIFNPRELARA